MAPGEEGLHVIDISDPTNPNVLAFVDTPSGSHTATLVPDLENDRLLVYNNSAPGGFDMIQVPLSDPASASYVGAFATGGGCHDWAVMLGDVKRAACSGGGGFRMFSLGGPSGGSLDNPLLLYSRPIPGTGGHSAAFTFDGKVYVHGWEPGGGSLPRGPGRWPASLGRGGLVHPPGAPAPPEARSPSPSRSPSLRRGSSAAARSRMRTTIVSPRTAGRTETRKSTSRPSHRILM